MSTAERTAQFLARALADCLSEATSDHWNRRAAQFDAAAPKASDFHGRATRAELVERGRRCRATAAACRARASLETAGRPIPPEVLFALGEVA